MNRNGRPSSNTNGPATGDSQVESWMAAATSHHQAGRFSKAEDLYRRVLAADPARAQALYNLGMLGIQTGRLDMASDLLRQAIVLNDGNPEWHYNLALAHQMRGRIDDAVVHYARAVGLDPGYAEAHTNLGNALKDKGRLDEAAAHYQETLRLKPGSPEVHYNLANVLAQQDRFAEAIEHYRHALALQPGFAEAHANLGIAWMQQGKLNEAAESSRRALALNPKIAEAHHNLGQVLAALGRTAEALACYQQAVVLQPKLVAAHKSLARALLAGRNGEQALAAAMLALRIEDAADTRALFIEAVQPWRSTPNLPGLRDLVMRALTERWCRPAMLVNAVSSLMAQDSVIQECLARAEPTGRTRRSAGEVLGESGLAALAGDELLRCILRSATMTGVAMERLLTCARSVMLTAAAAASDPAPNALAFHAALAEQCFINNYVFDASPEEFGRAQELTASLVAALSSGNRIRPMWPIAVAAYIPLHTLPNAEALLEGSWPDAVTDLLNRQVRQPLDERRLAAAIPALTAIDDGVSRAVRAQYEESPYPVWVATSLPAKPRAIGAELSAKFPLAPIRPRTKGDRTDVLIAGCGTGQQAVELARQIENAAVLAIDLSLASLGYAKRQTLGLGLSNIEYAQADILKLGSLGRTFDIIVSTGVLHHMTDPRAGLRTLLALLRPGGFMLLGLYSELARQDVVAVQVYAAARGFGPNSADIRRFRQELLDLERGSPLRAITDAPDFFSTSECRDLLFHVQEHRLTLPRIKNILAEHGLEFLGFESDPTVRRQYAAAYPDDKAMTDLDRWHAYETEHPRTFRGMYQFWVQNRA